jgi:myosin heavy subunit
MYHHTDKVPYTIGSFIEKNDNVVPKDLADLIESCPHDCIKQV